MKKVLGILLGSLFLLFGLGACKTDTKKENIIYHTNEEIDAQKITFKVSSVYRQFNSIEGGNYSSFNVYLFLDITLTNTTSEGVLVGAGNYYFKLATYSDQVNDLVEPLGNTGISDVGTDEVYSVQTTISGLQTKVVTMIFYASFSVKSKFLKLFYDDEVRIVSLENIQEPSTSQAVALNNGANFLGTNILPTRLYYLDTVGDSQSSLGVWNGRNLNMVSFTIRNDNNLDFDVSTLNFAFYQLNDGQKDYSKTNISEQAHLVVSGLGMILDHDGNVLGAGLSGNKIINPGYSKSFTIAFDCSKLTLGAQDNVLIVAG
ncbi:MAG: hypothetical protein LBV55_00005, partial [Acholeplasmatales bacterium]|nr:hypothetical protein [Acholeplasmatales bacterium]